jgi:cytochrome c
MKKTLLFLSAITLFLAACGGSSTDQASSSSSTATTTPTESKAPMEPGELLIVKSDCVGCHHTENKLIGPSYKDIAAKYPATEENISLLAGKIIKGGKGVWGPVPMTPHSKITEDDAKLMTKYILSLKK